jgi:signal peptidase II
MAKTYQTFFGIFIAVIIIDQIIKAIFLNGFDWNSSCISLNLTFNKGVAFSMFSSLGPYLKYIQIALIGGVFAYVISQKEVLKEYAVALGLILGGGVSNLLDRFMQEGVVDYVYWHCGFDFAIFNFADVMIDLGVIIILWIGFKKD